MATPMSNAKRTGKAKKAQAVEKKQERDEAALAARIVTVEYDGEDWSLDPEVMGSLELWDLLDEADESEDPQLAVRAMRLILGRDQSRKFFKGRDFTHLAEFLEKGTAAVKQPDPTVGSESSEPKKKPSKRTSAASTS